MYPETVALTLFVVSIFSMFINQLASEVSIISKWDTIYTKTIIPKGLPVAVAAPESSVDTVWFIKITSDIDMANIWSGTAMEIVSYWTALFKRILFKKGQYGKEWIHLQCKQKVLHHILQRVNFVSFC